MPWLLIRRAAAYVVDIVLLFLVLLPVGQLVRLAVGWPTGSPTGQEIWHASALNFSLPSWTYFVLSDSSARGATAGKWLLGLRVARVGGGSVGTGRALGRTAVKLLPWETTHLSAFALAGLEPWQLIGLTIANGLIVVYVVVAACTGGRRSVHDYVVATEVCRVPGGVGRSPGAPPSPKSVAGASHLLQRPGV
jgi:uncharacterized RDD family membrane protein YckC